MSLPFGVAIYFICWWIVLFAVLPFGVKTQAEEGDVVPGTPKSAPGLPLLLRKFLITTVIAGVVFAFIYMVLVHKIIALDDIPFLPRFDSAAEHSS